MRFLFEQNAVIPVMDLTLLVAAAALASACIGLFNGRDALRRTPLAGLREVGEPQ